MLLLLACTPDPIAVDTAGAAETTTLDTAETGAAGLTAEAVEAAWAAHLIGPQSISSRPIFRTFDAATTDRSEDCPGGTDDTAALSFDADCTTAGGTVYAGSAARTFPGEGALSEQLVADLVVQTAAGETWSGSGEALSQSTWSEAEGEVYTSIIDGSFHYTGPDSGDSFVARETTMSLTQERHRPDESARLLKLEGWIEEGGAVLSLTGLEVDQDLCAVGVLSITTGGMTTSLSLSDCTGCGPLTVDGSEGVETACLDLSPWMEWEN